MAELMRFQNDEHEEQRLPRNVEAEATFLGALLIDNRVAEDVQIRLRPEHFYEPLHGRIYEQALKLLDKNMVATPVTLKPYFESDEAMRALGGPSYLAKLTGDGAGLIGARDFANQIYDLALLRELVSVGRTLRSTPARRSTRKSRSRKRKPPSTAFPKAKRKRGASARSCRHRPRP